MASPGNPTAAGRLAGFDILRSGAAVAVVALHATAPYLWHRMPGLAWSVFDRPSHFADALGWAIELSIMPLFLLLAGYFAAPLWMRLGDAAFLKHRGARLLGPLAFAIVLILPMDLYTWLLGWVIEGHIEPRKVRSLKFETGVADGLWGLGHLWFLHYLFFYSVAWVALRRVTTRLGSGFVVRNPFAQVAGLAGAGWLILALVPEVVFGFQHAFLPVPSKWLYCGTYFAGGVTLALDSRLFQWTRDHARGLTAIGIFSTVAGVSLGYAWLEGRGGIPLRLIATGATVVTAWTLSLGLWGLAARNRWIAGPRLRYAAAASFWVYLIHHPVIGLVHIDLKLLAPELASQWKVPIAAAVAVVFSLLTFEVLIRRPPFARWMGVPKEFVKAGRTAAKVSPKAEQASPPAPLAPASAHRLTVGRSAHASSEPIAPNRLGKVG